MANKTTPWTERLRELVEAGPVSRDEAVAEMAGLVPPGRAYRDTERVLDWVRDKHEYKSKRVPTDKEQTKSIRIKGGQKRIARSALWTQIHHGRIEEYTVKGIRMLRKGPNSWGAEPEAPASEA